MNWLDWLILGGTLFFITAYGIWKTRGEKNLDSYFKGQGQIPWWMIGLSVMATQASAITFMSTPGQAYDDGMRFIQFYFGLPLAMVILCITFLPRYMKLNVLTAYEFLENRFDVKTRTLAAVLFLLQRGLAAGITIYAPAIILSTILGWPLLPTTILIGLFVILYTVGGGSAAVSQTQKQQMMVMLGGMVVIFVTTIYLLPENIGLTDSLQIAGKLGKMNIVDFSFNLNDRYNFWSGITGGLFLALAYFGTDQSQVARYISGSSLTESRLGLLFNGIVKIPMQFFILLCGIMVYVFYLFNPAPIFFNDAALKKAQQTTYADSIQLQADQYNRIQNEKSLIITQFSGDTLSISKDDISRFRTLDIEEREVRTRVKSHIASAVPGAETRDTDYVFLAFVLKYMPHGIIGLLLAVIMCAAMSSTASEITALSSTTVVDLYKRSHTRKKSDLHYLKSSKWFTAIWGVLAIFFAIISSLFDNLIEAVNILGSLFYGTVLGIFLLAFYFKKIRGTAAFIAAICAEMVVIIFFFANEIGSLLTPFHQGVSQFFLEAGKISFLWYNVIGCLLVILFSHLQHLRFSKN